jgi:hypothetical protein
MATSSNNEWDDLLKTVDNSSMSCTTEGLQQMNKMMMRTIIKLGRNQEELTKRVVDLSQSLDLAVATSNLSKSIMQSEISELQAKISHMQSRTSQ